MQSEFDDDVSIDAEVLLIIAEELETFMSDNSGFGEGGESPNKYGRYGI